MQKQPNKVSKTTVTTLLLLTCSLAQETTDMTTEEATTMETTTLSLDVTCKNPTYIPRPLAPDVRAAAPFYVVAATRTKDTEEIDNICYTYFDQEPFTHIISVVYRNGSDSHLILNKQDIEGSPGIAEARGDDGSCLFHDYTLTPVCNETVFPLYRCFPFGGGCQLNMGSESGVDYRVVLAANSSVSPDCAGDIARSLSDTSELSGRQFLFLPNLLPPKCVTNYTTPSGITLRSIGAERDLSYLQHKESII